ncbi:presenilin-like protein At2g29900 [Neltuma alba]|uniref:presenilin-like protein At2g29900 n=1 Tax=Neltuma alba TaxID=207710 RepID=UPI0010A44173|nr:presenilin-like protein At2g29900 [Prosopis alba]
MAQNRSSQSVLDTMGEEIVRILAPVSLCMVLVVILVSILNDSSATSSISSIATMAYSETGTDSSWDKFVGAVLNSLAFVVAITVVTFVLVLLFYFRFTRFLKLYMGFSSFLVLGFLGSEIAMFLIEHFSVPIDCITFSLVAFNFAVVGVLAVFMSKMAIVITQGYLVLIGVLVAYWFTMLPEWTTWVLLAALALYDLAAVLLPIGPLKLLVELAISRDEEIPALVYEARPVNCDNLDPRAGVTQRRVWRDRRIENSNNQIDSNLSVGSNSTLNANALLNSNLDGSNPDVTHNATNLVMENAVSNPSFNSNTSDGICSDRNLVRAEEGQVQETDSELSAPLIDHGTNVQLNRAEAVSNANSMLEGIGLASSGGIKLGLGDFIFYSVLVGRAAMYDFMTVYACYLAIVAGLGITLMLLALYQKALPALPVSITLGMLFYFLTRLLLEVFVVQCSLNLLMF